MLMITTKEAPMQDYCAVGQVEKKKGWLRNGKWTLYIHKIGSSLMVNSMSTMKSTPRRLSSVKIDCYEDQTLNLNTSRNSPVEIQQLQDLHDGPLEAAFTCRRTV